MVNLLFISSNSKIDTIKKALQPVIKVKIDIVGDFDFGLKEVFEKRPAMVFIQDLIAGVTGESVARHIQMLLGSSAPSFIFMHDGNLKAKPIKGLYDYQIDLSPDDTTVLAEIQSTLKLLLGPEWQKFYVLPKIDKSVVKASLAVPGERSAIADQLVDGFNPDLGNFSSLPITAHDSLTAFAVPVAFPEEPFKFVSSPQDQLAEIISENAREQQETEAASALACNAKTEKLLSPSGATVPSGKIEQPATLPDCTKPNEHITAITS